MSNPAAVLAIHGGAGAVPRASLTADRAGEYHDALRRIATAGQAMLADGASALDAVVAAVALLEDCPLFNAGRGAVYTEAGTHELDAAVMDGASRAAGAVAGVAGIRNPVAAARLVMERTAHVLMVGAGAERLARRHGLAFEPPEYFGSELRLAQLRQARARAAVAPDHDLPGRMGTVGAVARDAHGHLAAATSTGGMTNKLVGRVGDSPLIGAGCYADDRAVAVSTTGIGEAFIRCVAAHEVAAQIVHARRPLQQAADDVIFRLLPEVGGDGGLIAVDAQGRVAMPFNTEGMYRAVARAGGEVRVAIHAEFA